jgi:hypothetical protein
MGRINKRSEAALKAAAEMIETTKNQSLKAQLIRAVIDYELRQQERADSHKAERRKRVKNKEVAGLRSKVQELADQLSSAERSKEKEASDIKAKLAEQKITFANCKHDLENAEQVADKARAAAAEMQRRLTVTQEVIEQLVRSVSAENRFDCASKLFQKLKSETSQHLGQLFKSMGLDLKTWRSWDSEYGDDTDLMLQVLLGSEMHEPERVSLLRSKLAATGRDCVDAIRAVRDYRDLKIGLDELRDRTPTHIRFMNLETSGLRILNSIPEKHMPRLTEEALRFASEKMASNPIQKLEWLEIVEKLLKPDHGIGSLLVMELQATRRAADKSKRHNG